MAAETVFQKYQRESQERRQSVAAVREGDPRYMSIGVGQPSRFVDIAYSKQGRGGGGRAVSAPVSLRPKTSQEITEEKKVEATAKRAERLLEREERLDVFKRGVYGRLGISEKPGFLELTSPPGSMQGYGVGLIKAFARSPLEIASIPTQVGGRIGLAADALRSKAGRSELLRAAKKTPGATIQTFDIRQPQGLVNVAYIALGAGQYGKARATSRAQKAQVAKDIKAAKIQKATVEVTKVKTKGGTTKYQVKKTGILKVGDKKIPFQEVALVTKKQLAAKVRSKILPKAGRVTTKVQSRIAKIMSKAIGKYKVGEKQVKIKTKIKAKEISYENAAALNELRGGLASEGIVETVGRIRGKGIKEEFISKQIGKKVTTISKSKYIDTLIKGEIRQLGKPIKGKTIYELRAIAKSIPKGKLMKQLRKIDKQLKSNAQRLKLRQIVRKTFKSKKATQAIGRPAPGDELIPRTPGRDTTAADRILKQLEDKMRAVEKSRTKAKGRAGTRAKSIDISPSVIDSILPGLKKALSNKIISIAPVIPVVSAGTKGIAGIEESPESQSIVGGDIIPIEEVISSEEPIVTEEEITDTTGDTGTKPGAVTSAVYTYFFTSYYISTVATNRLIPILPLLPGISGKASGAYFRMAYGGTRAAYNYIPDLPSLMYGVKAKKKDISALLRTGRIFTGLEARPIV